MGYASSDYDAGQQHMPNQITFTASVKAAAVLAFCQGDNSGFFVCKRQCTAEKSQDLQQSATVAGACSKTDNALLLSSFLLTFCSLL